MRMAAIPPTPTPTMSPRLVLVVLLVDSDVGALLGVRPPVEDEDMTVGELTLTPEKPELLNEVPIAAMVGELDRLEVSVPTDQ